MSGESFDAVPRKRLKSIIRRDNPNQVRRTENRKAFETVLDLYIRSRFECPLIRNGLAMIDDTNPSAHRAWTPDTAILVCDCELAIKKALGDSPALWDKLFAWFIAPEIEPGIDPPSKLTLDETSTYTKIVQRIGGEFRRRKIFPPRAYFRIPERNRWRELQEAA